MKKDSVERKEASNEAGEKENLAEKEKMPPNEEKICKVASTDSENKDEGEICKESNVQNDGGSAKKSTDSKTAKSALDKLAEDENKV